ncbi:MAG TPA: glycosyltransferase family 39 protein [Acidimicrobiales bacterium]
MRTLVTTEAEDEAAPRRDGEAPGWASRLAGLGPLALAGIVVVGVALRFVTTSSLWLDEALSVNISALPVGDLFEALEHDGHPPLYYLLLHGWMQVFGEGDVAVRALSGVFGVATLPLAWIAGRRLAGPSGARWALAVFALSPYAIRYSSETRMYSLVMLLVLAGYLLLTDALGAPTPKRLAALALLSGLLLLTHYWSFYLLGAVGLLLALRWWRTPAQRPATAKVLVAMAAGGVLFLPWLPGFLYQAAHTGTPWGEPFRPTEVISFTLNDLGGGVVSEAMLGGTVLVVLALLALFTVRSSGHEMALDVRTAPTVRLELAVVALTAGLGCLAGYATSATYQSRYAAVFVPLFLLAAAVGITRVPGPARVAAGAVVVVLSLGGIAWQQYYERTQAEEAASAIAEHAEPGDVVVYCPDQLGPDYSRALNRHVDDVVEVTYPLLSSPERVDWVDYADRNAAADPAAVAEEVRGRAGGNGIFVVWMSEYRTLEGQCEGLVNALGMGQQLVTEDGRRYYEPGNVHWFPGAG